VINQELFWEEARDLAPTLKLGSDAGYLATITSYSENSFIQSRIISGLYQPSMIDSYWLGGLYVDSVWTWITGEPFVFSNWSLYEPNNLTTETALSMWGPSNWGDHRQPGQWDNRLPNGDINQLDRSWAVIEWGELDMAATAPNFDTLIHLTQWPHEAGGNDHWYAIVALDLYFTQMQNVVKNIEYHGLKGHLATISSTEENDFVINQVVGQYRQSSHVDQYWLGGTETAGHWNWLDGSHWEYTNWAPGEPNNLKDETALTMWGPTVKIKGRRPGTWNNCCPDGNVNPYSHCYAIIEFDTN